MKDCRNLVSMKAPKGILEWNRVQKGLEVHGLIYERVWVQDSWLDVLLDESAKARKIKAVKVLCSFCGHEELLEWRPMDKRYGGYGFVHPEEYVDGGAACGSGEETLCPFCRVPVKVMKAANLGKNGKFVSDSTNVMSASVVGKERFLALTCWTVERRVFRDGHEELAARAAEAYIFSPNDCAKLTGWRNAYGGNTGYFIEYKSSWGQPKEWSESWGADESIYGLTPDLIEASCLPNCKLDVYMTAFVHEKAKFPVAYLRLYQYHPNVENLLVSGLPMVLDDLLYENMPNRKWKKNCKGIPLIEDINWNEQRPAQMLGLTKEELRLGREQSLGALLWRLFTGAKEYGERLTAEDIYNAHCLGEDDVLELVGRGPVGKSLRYLLKQIERMNGNPEIDPYVCADDYISVRELLDYWDMAETHGRDLNDPHVRFPQDLLTAHNQLAELGKIEQNCSLASKFRLRRKQLAKYILKYDGLKIIPAGSQKDLEREAETLNHCVWTYGEGHATGKYAIFFIRKTADPKKPYYTLQLDEKELTVKQNRGKNNCGKTQQVQAFEDLWLQWIRDGAKRDKKGQPVLPKKKEVHIA